MRAFITGITGQDGSYLAKFLLSKGYEVFGLVSRSSVPRLDNLERVGVVNEVSLILGDMSDHCSIMDAVSRARPDEIYNLAAMSFVGASWKQPIHTASVNGIGVLNILEAMKTLQPNAKFYQAGTSEMFGSNINDNGFQNETTSFHPRSPYGSSKVFAHNTVVNYRESYSMFCANGILFNHESPNRGIEFVTRKITDGVARIFLGQSETLELGYLESRRDWGYAGDFVEAMWLMLQVDTPDDYVIATGVDRSVREFLDCAFGVVGISEWSDYVKLNPKYIRPAEVDVLKGDSSKASDILGWRPKTEFENWVAEMVEADICRRKTYAE